MGRKVVSEIHCEFVAVLATCRLSLVSQLFRVLAPSLCSVHYLSVVLSCHQCYQLMVGQLLFCSPLVIGSDYDLHYAAEVSVLPLLARYHIHPSTTHTVFVQNCLQLYFKEEDVGALDRILLTALQNNVIDTIKLSRQVSFSVLCNGHWSRVPWPPAVPC